MLLVLLLLGFGFCAVTEIAASFVQDGDNVKLVFTETSDPQIDWSAFTSYTLTDCSEEITWVEDTVDLEYSFSHDDITNDAKCDFALVSGLEYKKTFTLYIDVGGTEYQEHFDIRFEVDASNSAVIGGSAQVTETITDNTKKIEHGITVDRVESDYGTWSDGDTKWQFTKGQTAYFLIESANVDFIGQETVELRVDTVTTGLDVSSEETITVNKVGDDLRMSFPIPTVEGMGFYDYIYFEFAVDASRRDIEVDTDLLFAIYPITITLSRSAKTAIYVVLGVVSGILGLIILLGGAFLVYKMSKKGKRSYAPMSDEPM